MRKKLNNESELDKVISKETDEMGFPVEYITENGDADLQDIDSGKIWLFLAAIFEILVTLLFIYLFILYDMSSFKKMELEGKIPLISFFGIMILVGLSLIFGTIHSIREKLK